MKTVCTLGKALHAAFVAALAAGKPAAQEETRWQGHKNHCDVCSGVKR